MPTESSVVSNLIRDLNTRRLPSEPSDGFLFQPVPNHRVPSQSPGRAVVPTAAAQPKTPVAKPARTVRAQPAARSTGSWWQAALAIAVVGGWMYFAAGIDSSEEPTSAAPTVATASAPAVQPTPAAPTVTPLEVVPAAPAATPPPPADPAPTMATVSSESAPAEPAAAVPAPAVETAEVVAPQKSPAKKHRRVKSKRVAKPRAKASTAIVDPFASRSEAVDTAKSAAAAPPPPPPPPPKPTAPAKPARQSDDSEDPLK